MAPAWEKEFLQGARDGIPIGLGYLSVSFSFGVMAVNLGLPVWAAVVISLTNLTSAGQFAGVGLMAAGAPLIEMVLTQLVINLRYSLMSLSLSQKADGTMTVLHRLICSFFVTDEIFALASNRRSLSRRYMYGLGLIPILSWTLGTALGALAGGLMPAALRSALNVALYAMFIALIVPAAKERRPVLLVILLAAGLSCLLRYAPALSRLSAGFAIIICALTAAFFGAVRWPIREEDRGAS
ncbi:MAG: AzlC family ABC transporter permease [Peptococcaceae bacterium]|nr:AzlC family ABC transporter permease [Peptococcaceae bacterium]